MASDPWTPWADSKGKGKGNPHTPVPEPAATGALLLLAALLTVGLARWRAARMRTRATESS